MRLGRSENRIRRKGGFTILEALIAMMVFGVTVSAVYSGLMMGVKAVRRAREQQRATQILTDTIEMIRLYSWDQLQTAGFVPTTFTVKDYGPIAAAPSGTATGVTYQGTISISNPVMSTNYDSRMKMVRVDLVWRSEGMERRRDLTTFVTLGGLYAFIF